ncbi:TonB-dependent receptor [Chitinophaga sp. YIM B06452]|uniref:SusC/RagA family TonB-linked outer membrane protein n=1 Tax=Chitinophaga sp. YIM B06452 TaxID=3082158 RepID=UPI0031FEDE83
MFLKLLPVLRQLSARAIRAIPVLLLLCWSATVMAQNTKVTGKITDDKGVALPGASIGEEGTGNGVLSDGNGNYSITVKPGARLLVSYIGFATQTITVDGKTTINITLRPDADASLNEVVVIGYGTARRRDVTGAINTVTTKDFGNNSATTPSQLLQGKTPGVQVLNTSGVPGSGANIIIRGVGSFTNVSPLYVIDGIQSDAGLFNAINPQDIESITILKDAASTAIYGAAAANGVVLITTKRAKTGAPKVSVTSQWGWAKRSKKLDVLDAAQYAELAKDYAAAQGSTLPDKFNSPDILVTRTDWQDAIFRTGALSNNAVSVSGGTDHVLYNASFGYIDQQAIVQDYRYRAMNFRISLEEKLGIFRFGQALNAQFLNNKGNLADVTSALYMPPYFSIYDPSRLGGYTAATNVLDLSNAGNPLVKIGNTNTVNRNYILYPQFFGEVNILKSLKVRSQIALSIGGNNLSEYQQPYIDGNDLATGRSATEAQSSYNWYLLENYATWNQSFGKHNLELTVGNTYKDKGRSSFVRAQGTGIANDQVQNISVALTNTVTGANVGYGNNNVGISYFGRVMYNFNDRYILTASLRRDGSSVFGPENKFGNFPGVGLAWNVSNEEFMHKVALITDLKLRVSWGKTGNNNIAAFQTTPTTYSGSPTGNLVYSFGPGETFVSGTTVNSIPNPGLKWEETVQTNAGFDLGMFDNKLNLSFDWYNRKNNDLLVQVPVPNSTGAGGVSGSPTIASNAASAKNTGVEFAVTYRAQTAGGFGYSIGVNGGYNKNEVISLGNEFSAPIRDGAFSQNSAATYTAKGFPIGSFYGRLVDHVAIDQGDIDTYNEIARKATNDPNAVYQANLKPGDFIFRDINGNGFIDDQDMTVLGNPIPKFVFGGTINLSYRNFDFNLAAAGVSGLKLYKEQNSVLLGTSALHNVSTDMLNRWRKPGDRAPLPRAGQNQTANLQPSDFYIEDGSYLRVRMITLGYTFPRSMLNTATKGVLSSVRLYISAENLITLTGYSGYDPEISTPSGSSFIFARGIDRGQLPQPKTFLVGVQLGL